MNKFENIFEKEKLDFIMYIVGIISPLFTIYQAYYIYIIESSIGISLLTWIWYFIATICWILYGIINKQKPIIFTNSIWIVAIIIILIEILIYR